MIEVKITQEMRTRAALKSQRMGLLNNSITSGDGNMAGFLGEEVANQILKGVISNTYDYDILSNGKKWDVKTKRCTSAPKEHYECSIAAYNTKQDCDDYAFVRIEFVDGQYKRAWFLGTYNKDQYFDDASFLIKGQIDPSNNFRVKANCYNLPIRNLKNKYGFEVDHQK